MLSKSDIIKKALNLGFVDVGFTTAEPFITQKEVLLSRQELYSWTAEKGLDLMGGTDPLSILPRAKSIIVLIEAYFRNAFPTSMEAAFGRCYLDDDRVTKDGLSMRLKDIRGYLRENGIESKVPFNLPHRLAAARAGLGTFGKNCLIYSNKAARKSSWILPLALVVDQKFDPDEPSVEVGCPQWCKNACIAACPTGALLGPRKIDPRKCISFLTYYGEGITPLELREPMGMRVYGCDRCQNVCPRNEAWMAQEMPINQKVADRAGDFDLRSLLHMDVQYFKTRIWPHMFYMSHKELWRWHMNVARAMGNSLDTAFVPDLLQALRENPDDRVKSMSAWALGRIGDPGSKEHLKNYLGQTSGSVREETELALDMF